MRDYLPLGPVLAAIVAWCPAAHADSYAWPAESPPLQLAADRTPIPPGQGALFVPTITGAQAEPDVLVVDASGVRPAPVGSRVILPPGRYVVLVGSSEPATSAGIPVVVRAGQTALVPVQWGALRIQVRDTRDRPAEVAYQLTRVDSGEVVELSPERAAGAETWLLRPGLYRLAAPNSPRTSGPGVLTVHVPEAGLANFRLFIDPATRQIRGGSVVDLGDATAAEQLDVRSPWTGALIAGVQANAAQNSHLPGMPDISLVSGSVFADGRLEYLGSFQTLRVTGTVEQGSQYVEVLDNRPLPLIKTRDRLEGQALYALYLNSALGIYGRASGTTQLFDTRAVASEDVEVAIREPDGSVTYRDVSGGDTYALADALSPSIYKLGAGLRSSLFNWRAFRLSVRGGPGIRYNNYGGALISEDNPDTPALEYTRIRSFQQSGLEAAVSLTIQGKGWVSFTTTAEGFSEWGALATPILELDSSLNLRITELLSLNYTATAAANPYVSDELQLRQGGVLRLSWSLL